MIGLSALTKFNFLLFWAKLHVFSKTLENYEQKSLMNQKCIEELVNKSNQGKLIQHSVNASTLKYFFKGCHPIGMALFDYFSTHNCIIKTKK